MNEQTDEFAQILEAAYRQTLASFHEQVTNGERDPATELSEYRRRRRDYATCLRMEHIPDEARELADRLLETHRLQPEATRRREFEHDVTMLLVRLYDAFIEAADSSQGNR